MVPVLVEMLELHGVQYWDIVSDTDSVYFQAVETEDSKAAKMVVFEVVYLVVQWDFDSAGSKEIVVDYEQAA